LFEVQDKNIWLGTPLALPLLRPDLCVLVDKLAQNGQIFFLWVYGHLLPVLSFTKKAVKYGSKNISSISQFTPRMRNGEPNMDYESKHQ
jgi:hypothetical protein